MDQTFFISCFFLGIIAASPGGPLCMLVFNRSARSGFWAGLYTGFGAACADAIYAFLGLAGMLQALDIHQSLAPILFAGGGIVLWAVGASLLIRPQSERVSVAAASTYTSMVLQGCILTLLNPLVALFFMTAGMQFLASYYDSLTHHMMMQGAVLVGSGSFFVFVVTSGIGSLFSKKASVHGMILIRRITGVALIVGGSIMLASAVRTISFLNRL